MFFFEVLDLIGVEFFFFPLLLEVVIGKLSYSLKVLVIDIVSHDFKNDRILSLPYPI